MPLAVDSSLLEAKFRPFQTKIGWRETKNFAAALGDANPLYFDDESPGGIYAPPTFPVAITWTIVSRLNEFLQEKSLPPDVLKTMVHVSEYLILRRLLKPGDVISIQTDVVSVVPQKAGTRLSLRFRAKDNTNRPVFEEISSALFRGVTCSGTCGSKQDAPHVPEHPKNLRLVRQKEIKISTLFPYLYDGCTNIVFPIHTSRAFAHRIGLPDILVQGTATLGLAVREIFSLEVNGDPRKIKSIYGQFTGMVFPGTEITLQIFEPQESLGKMNLYFSVLNREGQFAIRNGVIQISQDSK